MMCILSINIPKEILIVLCEDTNEFADYMRNILTLDLYKNRNVSLGYCASVAEMTKEEFVQYFGKVDVSIFSFNSKNEFLEELANA